MSLSKFKASFHHLSIDKCRRLRANLSIDTDPQQQKAVSPQVLVVRSFLR
jgi:hypothetical protein